MPEHSLGPFSGKIDGLGPFFFLGGGKEGTFFREVAWKKKEENRKKERQVTLSYRNPKDTGQMEPLSSFSRFLQDLIDKQQKENNMNCPNVLNIVHHHPLSFW